MEIGRREFMMRSLACALGINVFPGQYLSSLARRTRSETPGLPYFVVEGNNLVNIAGGNLHFGTSIYPFRKGQDPSWLLDECRSLGLTEIRFSYPREHFDHSGMSTQFDPGHYQNPYRDLTRMLAESPFDVILTIQGHAADSRGHPLDWPRNPDGSIDGKTAAPSFANWTRWLVNHTKDYVDTYELWNEAFGHIDDQAARKSFGPGGSKENADNYANMMLPALEQVKRWAPGAKVAIEGNYWNTQRSAGSSYAFQQLLSMSDYVIRHPYGYIPRMYEPIGPDGKPGFLIEAMEVYRQYNRNVRWWYSEYGVSAKDVGLQEDQMPEEVQAKAVLRSTLLHLRHRIDHLDIFALYYPSSKCFPLCASDRSRRLAWLAYQRLIASCQPKQRSITSRLVRSTSIPSQLRDLAIASGNGFTYCLWQETDVHSFKERTPPVQAQVTLSDATGRPLKVAGIVDPITGLSPTNVEVCHSVRDLTITLPVADYPLLCKINVS